MCGATSRTIRIQPQQRFVDEFASLKVKDADFSDYQAREVRHGA